MPLRAVIVDALRHAVPLVQFYGFHASLGSQVSGMSLLAATRYQVLFYHLTSAGARGQPTNIGPVIGDLERDRRRSLADKAAQTTLLGTVAALCYGLIVFGGAALYALPAIYSGILVFYDARPDIAQRIFPRLWQEK